MLCWISWCSVILGSLVEVRAGVSLDLLVCVLMQGLFLRMFHSPLPLPSLENSLRRAAGIYLEPGKLKVQLQAQPNFLHQLHFSHLLSCPLGLDMQDVELLVLSLRHVPLPEAQADPGLLVLAVPPGWSNSH